MSTESKKEKRDKHRKRRQVKAEKLRLEREEYRHTAEELHRSRVSMEAAQADAADLRQRLHAEQDRSADLERRLLESTENARLLADDNVKLTAQLRAAETRATDRDSLAAEVARYHAEDRDVNKLRRRLQERNDLLEETRRQLSAAKEKIPPKPFVVGYETTERVD